MYACGEKVNVAHGYFGTNLNRWGDRVFDPQHRDFGSSWVWQFPPTIPRWKYLHGLKLHYIISLWMRLSEISLVRCGVSFLQICSNGSSKNFSDVLLLSGLVFKVWGLHPATKFCQWKNWSGKVKDVQACALPLIWANAVNILLHSKLSLTQTSDRGSCL